MTTYYAVCDVNGPISRELRATDAVAAVAEFEAADTRAWIDEPALDAEDIAGIEGENMDEDAFAAELERLGSVMVRDLAPIHNYHAGTTAHLAGGWCLWEFDD